ncbi:hypothetical protein Z945_3021 [Sulfitobacter noctilucae]|uniref:type VI secretion system protein TssA n=1 Tax=Sulfitobacter noctilucae TaxID=1342302 RepID=UPI000469ED35|nr:type VI secretion system ImpA family N-terminal domain-containing protein [Sulfitobacter noctilucae]KIN75122.1 hypothetical protein Z945_3021 [Sulfitobacter noctilucae]
MLDELLMPITEEAPCGPDLDAEMDADYEAYYFGALGRLPAYFYRPGVERPDGTSSPDMIFDGGDVDIAAERQQIEPLLSRSRDLRLLVLLAQWEALAGRLGPLADVLETIAALIETFGADAHPGLGDGPAARRDVLNDLNTQVTMIQPLQFLGLTGTDEVSLRKMKVASGAVTPLQSEQDLTPAVLNDALSDPANKKRIETTHAALMRMADALGRITRACQSAEPTPFTPSLDLLSATVAEMLSALSTARPDLRAAEEQAVADQAVETAADSPAASEGANAQAPVGPAVLSHAEARQMLEAVEHYYRRAEPSSAALLLVTQARLLIGSPLVEALETLLPDRAGKAMVDFGPQTGFVLNIERLRQLTGSAPESSAPEDKTPAPSSSPPVIGSGAEAAGAIKSVEAYFTRAERSSPVPVLLQRARSYLDRDFQSLVDELVPLSETNS